MILDRGNVLTKVHEYHLQRPDITIRIRVHEIILGSEDKFLALPVDPLGMNSSNLELQIKGDTELKALEELVEKIKDMPKENIFPKHKHKE